MSLSFRKQHECILVCLYPKRGLLFEVIAQMFVLGWFMMNVIYETHWNFERAHKFIGFNIFGFFFLLSFFLSCSIALLLCMREFVCVCGWICFVPERCLPFFQTYRCVYVISFDNQFPHRNVNIRYGFSLRDAPNTPHPKHSDLNNSNRNEYVSINLQIYTNP